VLARLAAHGLKEHSPEPFDRATDEALSPEQRKELAAFELLEEEAFDPAVRSNGAVVRLNDGSRLHIRRGSPEYFFERDLAPREKLGAWLEDEERQGRRVLGVSYDDGSGAMFGGFVSFADTLKATTVETIAAARRLNVVITIITGDALKVAEAVGREAGLVADSDEVIKATEFLALPVQERHKRIGIIRVFARTTPEQKLELIGLLKEQYTVGFLGEGINDAPALKAAHVSMVVQSAADVARETADIVLVKNDLRVIVDGIRLGRETHANTLKYIRATLVSNFGNFYAVAIGSLFISFLPMLPKQLLLLNLLSDFPMMAIAFDRVSEQEVARAQSYDFRSLYIIF
jgi:Mg2+-importing ATPase